MECREEKSVLREIREGREKGALIALLPLGVLEAQVCSMLLHIEIPMWILKPGASTKHVYM
jgi:hypothetical protein